MLRGGPGLVAPLASASFSSSSRQLQAPASASPNADGEQLGWDRYLQLRRQRRIAGLVTTVPTTLLAGASSASYFMSLEIDPSAAIAGIDPSIIYIGATLAFTGLGWLVGPTLGSSIWSLVHRNKAKQIALKDHDFYEHIKRMRVDPTRQSVQNPVPDYYGEKIGSIKQYRQWLRDQVSVTEPQCNLSFLSDSQLTRSPIHLRLRTEERRPTASSRMHKQYD